MLASRLGLVAASALVAGLAGCSLPEVLPLAGGTTSGPSPYGVWYEQHWATNSVLLAAADQPDGEEAPLPDDASEGLPEGMTFDDEAAADGLGSGGTLPENIQADGAKASVEASARPGDQARDFDDSTPYQFPAGTYSGSPQRSTVIPNDDLVPVSPKAPEPTAAPPSGGPIRY
jgi:hypothetical protein